MGNPSSPALASFLPRIVPQSAAQFNSCSFSRTSLNTRIHSIASSRSALVLHPVLHFHDGRHRNGNRPTPERREQRHHHRSTHCHRRRSGALRRGLDHPRDQRARGSKRRGSPRAVRRLRGHQESAYESRPTNRLRQGLLVVKHAPHFHRYRECG